MADLDELLKLLDEEESSDREKPIREGSTNNKDVHINSKNCGPGKHG